jgi:hypothetical protein
LLAGFFVSQLPWYFDLDTQLDAGARGSILSVRHYFAQWLVRRRCADDRARASPLVGTQVLLRAILGQLPARPPPARSFSGCVGLQQERKPPRSGPRPCGSCGGIQKPDVVFFGESVPRDQVAAAQAALEEADAMLVVGSSLMVYSGLSIRRSRASMGHARTHPPPID